MGNKINIDQSLFIPVGSHNDGLVISSAVDLITTINDSNVTKLLIQSLTQNSRYTLDGTTPTSTKGFQLKTTDPPVIISLVGITSLKVIQEAATADLQFQGGK